MITPPELEKKSAMLTVCIPTYNASRFLRFAVDSLLSQSFQDFKVHFIDDASTDETIQILKSYCEADSRFELFQHSVNSGACGLAIQESLQRTTTPYFSWFGAPDVLTPNYFKVLIEHIEKTKSDYVFSDFEIIDALDQRSGFWRFPLVEFQDYVYKVLCTLSGSLPMNGVLKKASLTELGLDWLLYHGESRSSDTINGIYFRSHGLKMSRVAQPLFKYRLHNTNLSKDMRGRYETFKNVIDFIFDLLPDMVTLFASQHSMNVLQFKELIYTRAEYLAKTRK